MDNMGIVVKSLGKAISLFTEIGLKSEEARPVKEGEMGWPHRAGLALSR